MVNQSKYELGSRTHLGSKGFLAAGFSFLSNALFENAPEQQPLTALCQISIRQQHEL